MLVAEIFTYLASKGKKTVDVAYVAAVNPFWMASHDNELQAHEARMQYQDQELYFRGLRA